MTAQRTRTVVDLDLDAAEPHLDRDEADRLAAIDPPLYAVDPDPNLIPIPFNGGDWRGAALCAQTDPEAFFPDQGGSTREAKRVCLVCEVRLQCLDYALRTDQRYGVWGGLSERERRRVNKPRVI